MFFKLDTVPLVCRMDPEEGTSLLRGHPREEAVSMRERFCRGFFMAVSFIGSVIGIFGVIYLFYINHPSAPPTLPVIFVLFFSVLSAAVFFAFWDNCCCSSNRRRTFAAVPIPVASMEEFKVVCTRSQSERALTEAVARENLTRSLPPYILLSTDQMPSANSSMDLFLSAESRQTDSKEASTSTVVKAPVQTPSITVSEVESLPRESDGDSSEIQTAEVPSATDVPSKATDEKGVRQRRVTPPEEQKYEPVQEKTD